MRVLIISPIYPPEPAQLVEELATALARLGHDVEVLTALPNYPAGRLYDGYKFRLWSRETRNGIHIVRVALYMDHGRSAGRRFLHYATFALASSLFGSFLLTRPDVIYVYGSPVSSAPAARWLSWRWSVPFVFAVPDLWPEALQAAGVRSRMILRLVDAFMKRVYTAASHVITFSSGFRRRIVEKGNPPEKIVHVPVWVDLDRYSSSLPDAEIRRKLGITREVVVMYAGNIGYLQGLDVIVLVAELLREREDIEFVLVGDGNARARLEQEVQTRGLRNVRFPGSFAADAMPSIYGQSSLLLLHLKDDPLMRMWVPHKVYSYLAAAKPILCAVRGDAAEIVENARAGYICPPGDAERIAETIRAFAELSAEQREEFGISGRHFAEACYSMPMLIQRVEGILRQAAGSAVGTIRNV